MLALRFAKAILSIDGLNPAQHVPSSSPPSFLNTAQLTLILLCLCVHVFPSFQNVLPGGQPSKPCSRGTHTTPPPTAFAKVHPGRRPPLRPSRPVWLRPRLPRAHSKSPPLEEFPKILRGRPRPSQDGDSHAPAHSPETSVSEGGRLGSPAGWGRGDVRQPASELAPGHRACVEYLW
jgi:hypothetical protein